MTDEQRETVAAALTRKLFKADELLITQGDIGTEFIIIEAGEVVCIENKKVGEHVVSNEVARRGKGEYVGEGALLNDEPRNADVKAVGRVASLHMEKVRTVISVESIR
jgi:CRP-like cAMP-binding protein